MRRPTWLGLREELARLLRETAPPGVRGDSTRCARRLLEALDRDIAIAQELPTQRERAERLGVDVASARRHGL